MLHRPFSRQVTVAAASFGRRQETMGFRCLETGVGMVVCIAMIVGVKLCPVVGSVRGFVSEKSRGDCLRYCVTEVLNIRLHIPPPTLQSTVLYRIRCPPLSTQNHSELSCYSCMVRVGLEAFAKPRTTPSDGNQITNADTNLVWWVPPQTTKLGRAGLMNINSHCHRIRPHPVWQFASTMGKLFCQRKATR